VGLLRRRLVTKLSLTHIGKESNLLEEVEAGLVHDPDEIYTEYVDARRDPAWEAVVAVLKQMTRSRLLQETGLSRSTITALRNGHAQPHDTAREALTQAAAKFVGEELFDVGAKVSQRDTTACVHYIRKLGMGTRAG
jgi:hypothetical protein